jgi:hypothetical protein
MLNYRYPIPALTFSPQQSLKKVIMMLGCICHQEQDSDPALVYATSHKLPMPGFHQVCDGPDMMDVN